MKNAAVVLHQLLKTGRAKQAAVSLGGGRYSTGNPGISAEAGYSNLMGLLPIPEAGLRLGTRGLGLSVGGPIPHLGVDTGVQSGWSGSAPRSFWRWTADSFRPNDQVLMEELDEIMGREDHTVEQLMQAMKDRGYIVPEDEREREKLYQKLRDGREVPEELEEQELLR